MNSAWGKASFEKYVVRFCENEEGLKQREAETFDRLQSTGSPTFLTLPKIPRPLVPGHVGLLPIFLHAGFLARY